MAGLHRWRRGAWGRRTEARRTGAGAAGFLPGNGTNSAARAADAAEFMPFPAKAGETRGDSAEFASFPAISPSPPPFFARPTQRPREDRARRGSSTDVAPTLSELTAQRQPPPPRGSARHLTVASRTRPPSPAISAPPTAPPAAVPSLHSCAPNAFRRLAPAVLPPAPTPQLRPVALRRRLPHRRSTAPSPSPPPPPQFHPHRLIPARQLRDSAARRLLAPRPHPQRFSLPRHRSSVKIV